MKVEKIEKPDYQNYDIAEQAKCLRDFTIRNDLWIPDNFYENLRKGDVIDLYENPPSMKQLYCNPLFKELCSYSDEQMKHIPFPKLFWRSDEIQHKIVFRASYVAFKSETALSWDVEKHELIEALHPQKRTFEIDLGYVAPCFRGDERSRHAFVSSLRVNLIFEQPKSHEAS